MYGGALLKDRRQKGGIFMAKGQNQKLKLLYLLKIFTEETDDTHGLSRQELIVKLNSHGITADRKTLYADFEELRKFGIDIITEHEGNDWTYHIGERDFELAELKLLVSVYFHLAPWWV